MSAWNPREIFETLQKNAIHLRYEQADVPLSRGASKFGGKPHLPRDFAWPYFKGESFDNVTANRPLSFLLQINLAEVHPLDTDNRLPSSGMLYFFYECATMFWGFDPADRGCARVFYCDEPLDRLVETGFPADMEEDYRFPELAVSFISKPDAPDYAEYAEHYDLPDNESPWEDYNEERLAFCRLSEEGYGSKLLGYADVIQNDMLLECEEVSNGIYRGDGIAKLTQEQKDAFLANSKDWTLLCQIGTVSGENENFELMFGDCGCIYFYIKKQDLAARNFDRIWMILQCY